MAGSLAACGSTTSESSVSSHDTSVQENEENTSTDNAAQEQTETTDPQEDNKADVSDSTIGTVSNSLAEDEDTLIATYAGKFEQKTYED